MAIFFKALEQSLPEGTPLFVVSCLELWVETMSRRSPTPQNSLETWVSKMGTVTVTEAGNDDPGNGEG